MMKYYAPIYNGVEKLVRGYSILLFVKGMGGIGKSYHIENALKRFDADYITVHKVTEAYLPELLFKNSDKIIWFKDMGKLFSNPNIVNILKACNETKKENVQYVPRDVSINNYSHKLKEAGVPKNFQFSGSMIFDYNTANMRNKEDFYALLSRGDYVELCFSPLDVAEIMRQITKTKAEQRITDFIIDHYKNTNLLNLRTQQKAFDTYFFALNTHKDWRKLLKEELKRNESPARKFLYQFLGKSKMGCTDLKKKLIENGYCGSMRTADRRIKDWIEMGELRKVSDDDYNFLVKL